MRQKIPIGRIFLILFYQVIFFGIAYFLLKRVGAFGCFDDCFNFGAGDFILQGKRLYSQIFFNHQPLMAYISAGVQYITNPQTLFELVQYHKIAALVFANILGTALIMRFGFPVFISLISFEVTKFYIFGDRFLAEGFIVYPMIYLAVLVIYVLMNRRIYRWEYGVASICSWFIFWMREPFMPWACVVLGILFIIGYKGKNNRKYILISLGMFLLLHIVTIFFLPIREYIFNVITMNVEQEVGVQTWNALTVLQMFFYPVFIIARGLGTIFQNVLFIMSIMFCCLVVRELFWKKQYSLVVVVFVILALSNLRVVPVGRLYYDAFHLIPWYGIFLCCIGILISDVGQEKRTKNVGVVLICIIVLSIIGSLISSRSFVREHIDTQIEFTNGYGNYFVKGEVIKILSEPGDTMFVEMWEDPIYFVAGVPTAYPYAWYTSIMPKFSIYKHARDDMFVSHTPTFYVGACKIGETNSFVLSQSEAKEYVQLLNSGVPSCVYVNKEILSRITSEDSDRIGVYGYSLP